jgi:hypothetical protein
MIPLRFLSLVFAVLFLASCGEKKDIPASEADIPADSVISMEKMTLILGDVHIVEAALMLDRNSGKETKENAAKYYQGIFTKYHISRARYDMNLLYYRQYPAKMLKIYDTVIVKLEARQKKFKSPAD